MANLSQSLNAVKGWRTLVLSVGVAAVGVLQTFDWATVVTPEQIGPVMTGIGVVAAVLRALTTGPVGGEKK